MNRELIVAEWRRGLSSFAAAGVLLESAHNQDAVTRFYYSVFHAAKAALAVPEIETATHAGVRTMFSRHLVQTEELEPQWAGELSESLDDRIRADYNVFAHFSDEDAGDQHARATAFLDRIREYLLAEGLTENEIPSVPGD